MTNVVYALLVPFACGVGIQRLVAILDAFSTWKKAEPAKKAWVSALISFICGLFIVWLTDVHILRLIATAMATQLGGRCPDCVDVVVSALIMSAGTEGFNSIIKFLGYAKEQKKAQAADTTNTVKKANTAAFEALA